jgi:hypothetical protein
MVGLCRIFRAWLKEIRWDSYRKQPISRAELRGSAPLTPQSMICYWISIRKTINRGVSGAEPRVAI